MILGNKKKFPRRSSCASCFQIVTPGCLGLVVFRRNQMGTTMIAPRGKLM